jgi:hypothetical protein
LSKEKTTRGGKIKRADGSKHMPTSNALPHQQEGKRNGCRCRIPDKAGKSKEMGTKTVTTVTLDLEGQGPRKNKQTNTSINIL